MIQRGVSIACRPQPLFKLSMWLAIFVLDAPTVVALHMGATTTLPNIPPATSGGHPPCP